MVGPFAGEPYASMGDAVVRVPVLVARGCSRAPSRFQHYRIQRSWLSLGYATSLLAVTNFRAYLPGPAVLPCRFAGPWGVPTRSSAARTSASGSRAAQLLRAARASPAWNPATSRARAICDSSRSTSRANINNRGQTSLAWSPIASNGTGDSELLPCCQNDNSAAVRAPRDTPVEPAWVADRAKRRVDEKTAPEGSLVDSVPTLLGRRSSITLDRVTLPTQQKTAATTARPST